MTARHLAILGGNRMAVPAIEQIERAGHRTLVLDRAADAPARSVASRFLAVDFSDVPATLRALAEIELSGVLPLNDFGVRTAAALAAQRGLKGSGVEAARRLTNKVAMKRAWSAAGLPTPRWTWGKKQDILAGEFPSWDDFPCIVKPAFSGGGSRGVGLARDWRDVARIVSSNAAKYLDDEVIIEEFIAGTEHTIEMIVHDGSTRLLSISDKENYRGNVSVVQTLHFPGPIGHACRHLIEPLVAASIAALGLANGTTHTEVIVRDGTAYLLEVGGRPGGGLNFQPICELSTGWSYPTLLAAVMSGGQPDFSQRNPSVHLTWRYFDHGPGLVRRISGFEELRGEPDVVDIALYDKVGSPGLDMSDDLARPGYVLVKGSSNHAARARAQELESRVVFEMTAAQDDRCN